MSGKIFAKRENDDEYFELSRVNDCDIKFSEPENSETYKTYVGMSQTMEFTTTITEDCAKHLRKVLIPKGYRNADVLKRDGYLSTRNMEH